MHMRILHVTRLGPTDDDALVLEREKIYRIELTNLQPTRIFFLSTF